MDRLSRVFFAFVVLFASCFALAANEIKPDVEVMIPMRDGVQLPTNLYFPKSKVKVSEEKSEADEKKPPEKHPCVLVRHPLGRTMLDPAWLELVNDGYLLAVQSTRSSCDDTGKSLPYMTDGWGALADGYDTVEWLANCEWTNGKIATIGTSATGITELLLAPSAPPHLVCQHIEVAAPSLYQYAVWPGGQFRKEQVEGWLKVHKRDASVFSWLHDQSKYDTFWKQFNAVEYAQNIQAPQLHVGGWYDIFSQGTIDAFVAAQNNSQGTSKAEHRLIIGPWAHRWKTTKNFGDFVAPEKGIAPPHPINCKDWLDFHMRGKQDLLIKAPVVQYYVMGPFDGTPSSGNQWKSAHRWPPAVLYAQMYLTKEKLLKKENKQTEEIAVNVSFDTKDPVPTIGGRNLFIADGPKDQRALEARSDVVLFTTEALENDLEVTGKVACCLFASNVQRERDICCRVCDVYPDGKSILISEGVTHVMPQDGGEPQPIFVDLWSTSMVFAKGHKIRLTLSGSNFPAFETSLEPNPSKENVQSNVCFSIHSGGQYASYLALPIASS